MAKKKSLFERMKSNPKGDWTIGDVEAFCKQEGLDFRKPNGGSHHVVSSNHIFGNVTVPYKRPIKQGYIKSLVSYTEAHRRAERRKKDD
ncbi:hypothetical protein AB2B41_07635 [Marimonas sp. MJW-29]|uniref:Type II toxin-antitoxin system HicA family toxin n=1 Tax=Sulfitobacter sediminis TaxID=3234186 RepID=A0ABV3RMZ6_9RHOB